MSSDPLEDYNVGKKSGLVSIGSHKLWLSVQGPDRKPGEPLVIIIPGLTGSTTSWAAVTRQLTPFIRVMQYERSGYGLSETSTDKPTASNIARELDLLLSEAILLPPYLAVAHSWGGVLSREFLALRPKDILGMVFVDANQERTLDVLDWRKLAFSALLDGIDNDAATGILHCHKLTEDEWRHYKETESTARHRRQAALEVIEYPKSFSELTAKGQMNGQAPFLGDSPVCVVKGDNRADHEKRLKAGLALGARDEVKVAAYREMLDSWDEKDRALQSGILRLSTTSRYIETPADAGHDVHLTEPQVIIEGVRWVLSKIRGTSQQQ